MIFAIDLKGELDQPIGYAFRSWWHFDCNFLVYYETDSFMAGVAADVIQIMDTVV